MGKRETQRKRRERERKRERNDVVFQTILAPTSIIKRVITINRLKGNNEPQRRRLGIANCYHSLYSVYEFSSIKLI